MASRAYVAVQLQMKLSLVSHLELVPIAVSALPNDPSRCDFDILPILLCCHLRHPTQENKISEFKKEKGGS